MKNGQKTKQINEIVRINDRNNKMSIAIIRMNEIQKGEKYSKKCKKIRKMEKSKNEEKQPEIRANK